MKNPQEATEWGPFDPSPFVRAAIGMGISSRKVDALQRALWIKWDADGARAIVRETPPDGAADGISEVGEWDFSESECTFIMIDEKSYTIDFEQSQDNIRVICLQRPQEREIEISMEI